MKFKGEDISDLISDAISDEIVSKWRWGTVHDYVFPFAEKHYRIRLRYQPEQGLCGLDDDVEYECEEVEQVEVVVKKKVWQVVSP